MISPSCASFTVPHAPQAGISRLSSSAPALNLDLHVSSGHQQQPRCGSPKPCQQQHPSSAFTTLQARLGCFPRPGWLAIGCTTNIREAVLPELRGCVSRRRPCTVSRRTAGWQHGPCLQTGALMISVSFPLPFPSTHHPPTTHPRRPRATMMRCHHRAFLQR